MKTTIFLFNTSDFQINQLPMALQQTELDFCNFVVEELMKNEHNAYASNFRKVENYAAPRTRRSSKFIKAPKPMDLTILQTNLKNGKYSNSTDFRTDVGLIFTNCYDHESLLGVKFESCMQLEEAFRDLWEQKDDWIREHQPVETGSGEEDEHNNGNEDEHYEDNDGENEGNEQEKEEDEGDEDEGDEDEEEDNEEVKDEKKDIPEVPDQILVIQTQQLEKMAQHAAEAELAVERNNSELGDSVVDSLDPPNSTQNDHKRSREDEESGSRKSPRLSESLQCPNEEGLETVLPSIPLLASTPAPIFGDLIVSLSKTDPAFDCRVDRARLCATSIKLNEVLDKASQTYPPSVNGRLQYLLQLDDVVEDNVPQLVARPLSGLAQLRPDTASTEALKPCTNVKEEPGVREEAEIQEQKRKLFTDAYREMLIIMHGQGQEIDTSIPLHIALSKVELVTKVVAFYDVLPLTGRHLRAMINEYGDEVWPAIRNDPPRWLDLAMQLQDFWWYREAMIHIIGSFPDISLSGWSDISKYEIPAKVKSIIELKSRFLKTAVNNLANDLHNNDILDENGQLLPFGRRFEEWVAVHQWREWLSEELRKVRTITSHSTSIDASKIRPLIRKLHNGLHACFSVNEKRKELPPDRNHHWMKYEDHMNTMAAYAQRAVQVSGLAKNKLKVNVDGKAHAVEYLTCSDIDRGDVPWSSRQKKAADES